MYVDGPPRLPGARVELQASALAPQSPAPLCRRCPKWLWRPLPSAAGARSADPHDRVAAAFEDSARESMSLPTEVPSTAAGEYLRGGCSTDQLCPATVTGDPAEEARGARRRSVARCHRHWGACCSRGVCPWIPPAMLPRSLPVDPAVVAGGEPAAPVGSMDHAVAGSLLPLGARPGIPSLSFRVSLPPPPPPPNILPLSQPLEISPMPRSLMLSPSGTTSHVRPACPRRHRRFFPASSPPFELVGCSSTACPCPASCRAALFSRLVATVYGGG